METATPDYVVTTGDFIQEWMDDEGVNAAELSRRLGTSRKHVSELLRGVAPLSQTMALALERVTGVPARIWNQHESGYRSALAREEERRSLASEYERAKEYPLTYLRKWGYLRAPARDKAETVRQLLSLFGVASFEALDATWATGNVAYRRAAIGRDDAPALATWLALAESRGALAGLARYQRDHLLEALSELRAFTLEDPEKGIQRAVEMLREHGVALTLTPAIPGLGVHGATRWVNGHPVIQLSLLGKTDDQMWFTLFHELGHVLLHSDKALYIEGASTDEHAEEEANAFASELLVPTSRRDELPKRRSIEAILTLAEALGVAPSIVLGQAQRRTGDFAWGHALKRKVELAPHQQE